MAILTCNDCSPGQASDYQDKLYGKNRRVHNLTATSDKYRCTVCGKERYGSGALVDKKKKGK